MKPIVVFLSCLGIVGSQSSSLVDPTPSVPIAPSTVALTRPQLSRPIPSTPVIRTPQVPAPVAELQPKQEQRIEVDIKSQTLTAWLGEDKVFQFNCSTGRNNATPRGAFPIRQKLRHNRSLEKYGSVPIPYSLRLDIVRSGRRVPIAIHAHKSVPRYPASHGCIRLNHKDAATLFDWAEVGTTVQIQ